MKRLQAFRFRLEPTPTQQVLLRQFAGSARYVYNRALALEIQRRKDGEAHLGYNGTARLLPQWKKEPGTEWLSKCSAQVLQQALMDLDRAYKNFFKGRAKAPQFHKKGSKDSFRYPQRLKLEQDKARICLPKIGAVRYRKSREVLGTVKNVTIRLSGAKWFISIQTEREVEEPRHPHLSSVIGVDLGVARFATLSDGEVFTAPDLSGLERQVRRAQKALSRKKKGSKNREKAKRRLCRLHQKIAAVRNDFLHKTSTTLAKNHGVVVLEDLRVRNMSRSAKGTINAPGKHVRQKAGLNRVILRQGWGEFRRQLEYKLTWNGGMLVVVPPAHTSQTCSECNYRDKTNRKTQSRFSCQSCGYEANADDNAAKNILRAGRAHIACGGDLRPTAPPKRVRKAAPVKQEPAEGRQALSA